MHRRFHMLCLVTLFAVYFLIFVGGVVRTTGSGMGCPDWPKCFDRWKPPTSVSQLPPNYKEFYSEYRQKKNIRFARYLYYIGAGNTADQLLRDESVLDEPDFNATKTWIEYINRLIGAIIGLFIVALFLFSIALRKTSLNLVILSLVTLLTVIFQGWFGSIVVSTNLTSWTITIHMFLALVIVALLVVLLNISDPERLHRMPVVSKSFKWLLAGCIVVLLVQVFLGTEVRREVDILASSTWPRKVWIERLGTSFWIHRSCSLLVLIMNFIIAFKIKKTKDGKPLSISLMGLTLVLILTGIGMAYMSIPAFLQPLHLALAALLFGLQWHLFCRSNTYPKFELEMVK